MKKFETIRPLVDNQRKRIIKIMNNEGKLKAKESQICFHFNQQTSSYESRFTLYNQDEQPLYFRVFFYLINQIVSTFGKLLTYQNNTNRTIEPKKSIILSLKLKIPNQISRHHQKLIVSYSRRQLSSKVHLEADQIIDVKIDFDETIPEEDQMITQILKGDCEELCQEAAELLKNACVKKALYKYEESFLLFRQQANGLYGMAQCLYLMESWHEALQQIQTALILHNDQSYLWLKLKIVFEIIKDGLNSLQVIRGIKKQLKSITEVPNIQQKKKQMLQYLKTEEEKLISEKGGKYVAEFIEKALAKYETDPYIKKTLYKSFVDYQRQILEVFNMKKPHTIEEPPQYILDPITYEIMDQPLIVPSGHSFEQKSLLAYIYLFTRQQLRYEWARPNIALKSYIKNNQHLKQWTEYQNQISSFK